MGIEEYLYNVLGKQLGEIKYRYRERILNDIKNRMCSLLSRWNQEDFRRTILFVTDEEALFYEPAAPKDVKRFVVAAIRNSMLEVAASVNCNELKMREPLSDEKIRIITSSAICYFKECQFETLQEEARNLRYIDVYGEEKGLLKQVEDISNLDLATNTIGQSIMVTPIQICNAVSAIANGGNLMQPYIVKEIRDEKGATIKKNESKILRQVISKETSDEMRKIMESVVSEHGGKKAFVQGYHIGGKTGTAQKVGSTGKYTSGKYVASFVGVAPMNDPKYTVMVVIDEPKGYSYYGGSTAAPIAGNIIKQIMIYNNEPIDPNQPALEEDK